MKKNTEDSDLLTDNDADVKAKIQSAQPKTGVVPPRFDRPVGEQTVDDLLLSQMSEAANDTISEHAPPHILGEQSMMGTMPDPESDDDMLLNSHLMGLRLDEDEENPKPLNIAADVEAAERLRRTGGDFDEDDEY